MRCYSHSNKRHANRRRRRGFTLVEMMCAMVVLVIGVVAVFSLLVLGVNGDASSGNFSIARAGALQLVEAAREEGYGNETTALSSLGFVTDPAYPTSGLYVENGTSVNLPPGAKISFVVTPNYAGNTGSDELTVTIFWQAPERGTGITPGPGNAKYGNCSVSLSTCIAYGGLNGHDTIQ